jgi:hypothetical protein
MRQSNCIHVERKGYKLRNIFNMIDLMCYRHCRNALFVFLFISDDLGKRTLRKIQLFEQNYLRNGNNDDTIMCKFSLSSDLKTTANQRLKVGTSDLVT